MIQKITDWIIVITITIMAVILQMRGTYVTVVVVLAIFLLSFLSFLYNRDWQILAVCVALIVICWINDTATVLFPISAYSLFETEFVRKIVCRRKLQSLDIVYLVASILLIVSMITILTLSGRYIEIVLIVCSILLSFKTSYSESIRRRLVKSFDNARFEAIETSRKRRIEREREDERVYMATLEERNRIAREIHDDIGHMITRTIVQMQALKIVNKDETIDNELDSVSTTLNEAMNAIRRSVHELHNESIDLSISINDVVKPIQDRFKTKVTTLLESPVPNNVKVAIVAIVKESITNIVKHSSGDQVRVEIVENNTFWRIKIEDNGRNARFEYCAGAVGDGDGIGLANIVSRCDSLGGRARISADNSGFRVVCTIPIQEQKS